jgi:hypothetical protein
VHEAILPSLSKLCHLSPSCIYRTWTLVYTYCPICKYCILRTPFTTASTFFLLSNDASSRRADVISCDQSPASGTRRLLFDECLNDAPYAHGLSGHKYRDMAVAEVMTEAHEINGLQNGYVHTKPASIPEPAHMSRTHPQSTPTHASENVETSPASSKSKQSTQPSANHASQSTNTEQREWSPISTAFSSQEQVPEKDGEHTIEPSTQNLYHAVFQDPVHSTSARGSTGSPTKADTSTDVITERKRTASGQSKRASISSIHDLKMETSPGRSRASTTMSTASSGNVIEVSRDFLITPILILTPALSALHFHASPLSELI